MLSIIWGKKVQCFIILCEVKCGEKKTFWTRFPMCLHLHRVVAQMFTVSEFIHACEHSCQELQSIFSCWKTAWQQAQKWLSNAVWKMTKRFIWNILLWDLSSEARLCTRCQAEDARDLFFSDGKQFVADNTGCCSFSYYRYWYPVMVLAKLNYFKEKSGFCRLKWTKTLWAFVE